MAARFIPAGFLAAGLVNIVGVLVFSLGFTNARLSDEYPEVFSRFGLLAIMLWGAAYLAVARSSERVRWLVAVFAVEKFVYVGSWLIWWLRPTSDLSTLFDQSFLTAVFFTIYGPIDLLFGLFFAAVAAQTRE